MTSTLAHPTPTPADLLAAAHAVGPELSARAGANEADGTIAPDLVARLRSAGIFRMAQPRSLGGCEVAPSTIVEVVEELSRADGSAGWVAAIGAGGGAFSAWLEPEVALVALGVEADFTSATVFAPLGRFELAGADRVRCSGRWPFASGCRHAEWFVMGGFVADAAMPDWRLAWFPSEEGTILPDWDVLGLRATGSHDVTAADVVVPAELTMRPFTEAARHDGALWRLPFFTLAGTALVGVPLGIARHALDEIEALAPTKVRAGASAPLAEDPVVLESLVRVEARLHAARALVLDVLGEVWATACAGDEPTPRQCARFRLAAVQAMDTSVAAVDVAFDLAGSSAIRNDHPIQRCLRDVRTARQHAYFNRAVLQRVARVEMGVDESTFML